MKSKENKEHKNLATREGKGRQVLEYTDTGHRWKRQYTRASTEPQHGVSEGEV